MKESLIVNETQGTRVALLFTSAGRRVELLRHFKRALAEGGVEGLIVATDIDPLAPALSVADVPILVPRYSSPEYIPALAEICRAHAITAVFPLIDPDIPLLARNRQLLEASGARVGVIASEMVDVTRDKWLTTQFFQSLGLDTPQTWLPENFPAALRNSSPHLFVKPRSGSAGKDALAIRDWESFDYFVPRIAQPLIQELVVGPEITIDVTCDLDGNPLAVVPRKRIEVRSGEVAKGVTLFRADLQEKALRVARGLGTVGPITIQCIERDGVPYFTEINARFGGGLPLSVAAGAEIPRWLVARIAGREIEIPALGSHQSGLYMSRFDDAIFLPEAALQRRAPN